VINLISIDDRQKLVISTDPDVQVDDKAREQCTALPAESAKHSKEALVVTVRPLNSREAMQVFTGSEEDQTSTVYTACDIAIEDLAGPGIKASTSDEVSDLVLRLPFQVVAAIGTYIINASLNSDPT